MARRIKDAKVSVGCPPPSSGSGEEWKSFQFLIHDFANLRTTKRHYVASPEFNCYGHEWQLHVDPGGNDQSEEGKVSVYLYHLSKETITARFGIKVIDKFGKARNDFLSAKWDYTSTADNRGWHNFISRSDILDESQNILDDNGTLTVVVYIEEKPKSVFVPKNPFANIMQEMFNDETTADVCYEISTASEKKERRRCQSRQFHSTLTA